MTGSWHSFLTEIWRLCLWLIALVAVFTPLEQIFAVHSHRMLRKQVFTDLCYYFLNSLVPAILLGIPLGLLAGIAHRLIPSGFLQTMTGLAVGWRVAVGFVAGEVGYYWGHRLSHEIPLLWRFHSIHHSAEAMDFLVNTRAHPIDIVWGRFCMLIPVYLLGFGGPSITGGTAVPIAVVLIGTLWSFFVHANVRWRFGPLEWLVSTPLFHHWHHTKSGPINRNYASNLPLVDWVFGSLHLPGEWPADYGIRSKIPASLVDQLIHPFVPTERNRPASKQASLVRQIPPRQVQASAVGAGQQTPNSESNRPLTSTGPTAPQ